MSKEGPNRWGRWATSPSVGFLLWNISWVWYLEHALKLIQSMYLWVCLNNEEESQDCYKYPTSSFLILLDHHNNHNDETRLCHSAFINSNLLPTLGVVFNLYYFSHVYKPMEQIYQQHWIKTEVYKCLLSFSRLITLQSCFFLKLWSSCFMAECRVHDSFEYLSRSLSSRSHSLWVTERTTIRLVVVLIINLIMA